MTPIAIHHKAAGSRLHEGKQRAVVFCCARPSEEPSGRVARQFLKAGYTNVVAPKEGWNEWEKADYPIEPTDSALFPLPDFLA